jgi:putative transposase
VLDGETSSSVTNVAPKALSGLTEEQRLEAMTRFAALRPHIEDGVPLTRAAADAGVPLRSARRWLARYRSGGLPALGRQARSDQGERRLPEELVTFIEGVYLRALHPRSPPFTG